eukprot:scaffold4940_cov163-Amphora_coffeaeformis.AAC.3
MLRVGANHKVSGATPSTRHAKFPNRCTVVRFRRRTLDGIKSRAFANPCMTLQTDTRVGQFKAYRGSRLVLAIAAAAILCILFRVPFILRFGTRFVVRGWQENQKAARRERHLPFCCCCRVYHSMVAVVALMTADPPMTGEAKTSRVCQTRQSQFFVRATDEICSHHSQ